MRRIVSRNAFLRIVRFHEYGPCYLLSVLACGFVARYPVDSRILPVLLFVAASSIFGFVINDIADAELDRRAGVLRNPVASGDLSVAAAWVLAVVLLGLATLAIDLLSFPNGLLGILVIILFGGYSFGMRAKTRPGLDVVCHASWSAIYGVMAYSVYRPLDFVGAGLGGMLFMLSMLAQLVNEIRDCDSDRDMIRTTVTLVGKKWALKACVVLLFLVLALFVSIVLVGGLPWILLVFAPSIVFFVAPIINALQNEQKVPGLMPAFVSRGTIIGLLLLVTYLAVKITGAG
ncbi:MAG TPA: UbiA family prenyltransferase [Candidatus Acidoferrales bacterium]|nr:UbiA family prenyltransferase [Candidatus Acidoferrales bacterium]